jgi:hypothetical protein
MCAKAVKKSIKKAAKKTASPASKKKATTPKKLSRNKSDEPYGHSYSTPTGIADLVVLVGKNAELPKGFKRKIPVDLNEGAGGPYLFLCYKEATSKRNAITNLRIKASEIPNWPRGYMPVLDQDGDPADLNKDTDDPGKHLWLSYSKDDLYDVITGIGAIASLDEDGLSEVENRRWARVDQQDLNEDAGGWFVYLTIKRF